MRRLTKQRVFVPVAGVDFAPRAKDPAKKKQAERVYDVVAAAGQRGATKDDVATVLSDVPLPNIAYYLSQLAKAGVLHELGVAAKPAKPVNLIQLEAQALVTLEALLAAKAKAGTVNADADAAFATYAKVKAAYVGRLTATDEGTVNERTVALRQALLNIVKALF